MDEVERRKRFLVTVSDTLRNLVDIVERGNRSAECVIGSKNLPDGGRFRVRLVVERIEPDDPA